MSLEFLITSLVVVLLLRAGFACRARGGARGHLQREHRHRRRSIDGRLRGVQRRPAGVISVGLEITGVWTKEELSARIDRIGDTLTKIFNRAASESRPTGAVADEMALEIIANAAEAA